MTVAVNIAYGLDARRVKGEAPRARVAAMLALVQMERLADRLPRRLSGGQQQRVALARALAVEPRILLLDEPFGALDKNLRRDMQIEIKQLQRDYGITTILVTHDQEEALGLTDRIAVLNEGRVEQFAAPMAIYDRPASLFVSRFVGTSNLLAGEIAVQGG
jgi:putative spermidine/putrescine transport system ATP-binding protein